MYKGMDVFKFIASLLVVLLHCLGKTLGVSGTLFVRNITTLAVPFFFISSGYLFSSGLEKANDKKRYFRNYVKRLFVLYTFWGSIYLLLKFPEYYKLYGESILYLMAFIIRKVCFVGMGVYWYFLALLESIIILYLAIKLNKERMMFILSSFFFVYGILFSGFQDVLSNISIIKVLFDITYVIFSWTNNFLFMGCFYVIVGRIIYKNNIKLSMKTSLMCLLISFLLKYVESCYINMYILHQSELILFQVATSLFFFMLSLSIKPNISDNLSLKFRQCSTTIYMLHSIFLFFIDDRQQKNGVIVFMVICGLCFVCEYLLSKIKNKNIKYLFNRR